MIKVLVLCGDIWHPSATVHAGLAPLEAEGYGFVEGTDATDLPVGAMADYPLVILAKANTTSSTDETPWATAEVASAFQNHVRKGGGLIVIHSGIAGYESLEGLRRLMGGAFVSHPLQCPVTITPRPGHLLSAGSQTFTLVDEHYHVALEEKSARVFLTTTSAAGSQPGGWWRREGSGRVCVLTPGHNLEVWLHPAYQALLRNALRWCHPSLTK